MSFLFLVEKIRKYYCFLKTPNIKTPETQIYTLQKNTLLTKHYLAFVRWQVLSEHEFAPHIKWGITFLLTNFVLVLVVVRLVFERVLVLK